MAPFLSFTTRIQRHDSRCNWLQRYSSHYYSQFSLPGALLPVRNITKNRRKRSEMHKRARRKQKFRWVGQGNSVKGVSRCFYFSLHLWLLFFSFLLLYILDGGNGGGNVIDFKASIVLQWKISWRFSKIMENALASGGRWGFKCHLLAAIVTTERNILERGSGSTNSSSKPSLNRFPASIIDRHLF